MHDQYLYSEKEANHLATQCRFFFFFFETRCRFQLVTIEGTQLSFRSYLKIMYTNKYKFYPKKKRLCTWVHLKNLDYHIYTSLTRNKTSKNLLVSWIALITMGHV